MASFTTSMSNGFFYHKYEQWLLLPQVWAMASFTTMFSILNRTVIGMAPHRNRKICFAEFQYCILVGAPVVVCD